MSFFVYAGFSFFRAHNYYMHHASTMKHPCKHAGLLQSDVDEQLLLTIPFKNMVKIHSISVRAPEDGGCSAQRMHLIIDISTLC